MAISRRENWLVRYNVGYKLLALCLACMLWYYVAGQLNPLAKQTLSVPLELSPATTQLVPLSALPDVTITISGTRDLVQSLTDQDVQAYVDVSGQTAGVCSLPVKTSVPDNIQVLSIYPQMVQINLDYITTKKVPVKILLQGAPAAGFAAQNPAATPALVMVSGPSSLLGRVQDAPAVVNTAGADSNINVRVPLQAPGNDGRITLDPGEVSVAVPVAPSGPVKELPVIANITGTPSSGQTVNAVAVQPTTVTVTGPQDALAGLNWVSTQPVDITGAAGQVVKSVGLALPQGVTLVTQGQVQVTVQLETASPASPATPQQTQQSPQMQQMQQTQ
jgi:YbbR domain-containing protein